MPIERADRPIAPRRLMAVATDLLDASTLCAIATVGRDGRAHVNTAYFAWTRLLEIVWLSDPDSRHSRNVAANGSAAVVVYDSHQRWGRPDRGIQLFGTASRAPGRRIGEAERAYARRFPAYAAGELPGYGLYRFRPRRVKLLDERALGSGVFVVARASRGALTWVRTEIVTARPA